MVELYDEMDTMVSDTDAELANYQPQQEENMAAAMTSWSGKL
jgi:hypothetical protein